MSEKSKFVQMSCDFYNQHSESDKQWFARNYDQCDEPHQKDNLCMHKWQFPLYVLRSQQAEIDQLKKEKQQVQNRFNFLLDKNIRNEADYASLKLKVGAVLLKWKKESEHADRVASEDFVQNVLDACIDDLEGVIRGANG
ncbi:hypothetical protein [Acinetobacter sp.]|uniref:hypothetical protein n=1 Tax=Acinetobacter sp. TaxID=472 RepID=UPI00388E7059